MYWGQSLFFRSGTSLSAKTTACSTNIKASKKQWALVTCGTTGTSCMATACKTHKSQKHLYLCVRDPYDYAPKV